MSKYNTTTINAVMWYFGCSKKEARCIIEQMPEHMRKALTDVFTENAKKCFYTD